MAVLTVIAGPNGAGKSTLSSCLDFYSGGRLVDPDAIAREMNPADQRTVALEAGREAARRIQVYLAARENFALETTLAGRTRLPLILQAKRQGFSVLLAFIGLDSAERCIARIQNRAAMGGHSIPAFEVRRRYIRSLANLPAAVAAADVSKLYDNSGDGHRLVLLAEAGRVLWRGAPMPAWVQL